ncbi:MAG TPA: hypothetical protein VGP17_14895 [Solirubrobacteraceae bacterium]|jgi:hypothetical protein|nr:hypothetical protein [Solirubrobacteraceae bacterium]
MKRLVLLMSAAVIAVPGAAAWLATAAPVAHAETGYSCKSCAKESGPNQNPIDINRGVNESGKGVCSELWRYEGGSSYTLVAQNCTESGSVIWAESGSINGHGEVRRWFSEFLYNLQGIQAEV